jgi:OmpA-OmpF porin, OOP family
MRLLTGLSGALLGSFVLTDLHAATSLAPDNGGGIDLRLFRSAVDSKGFFTVDGADVIGKGDVAFGLVLDGGRFKDRVIDTQFHGVLLGSYSPLRNLTVGMGLPTDLVSGDPIASPPAGVLPNQKTDVNAFFNGAWLAYAKYRFFDNLAVVVRAETALSDDARRGYAASPGTTLTPTLVLEGRLRRLRVGANLGASALFGDGSRLGDIKHGHLARAGVAVSYRLTDDLDLVAESYGSKLLTAGAPSAEAVGGVKVFVEKNSYLMIGGGVGYTDGYQAAAQRAFLGFVFEPSVGDRDGDGVRDDVDQCPDTPEDRDGFHDEDGCPDPDNDEDTILDKFDACPNEAETWNGYMDHDGCPDKLPGDHESIVEVEEKKPVLEFDHGIGRMLEPIQFEYDSAKIAKESIKTVDEVAKILQEHGDFTVIEIGGHADERGYDKYNLELTQKRVESVRKALIDRGINPSRLRARGYGEYCPLEDAHTETAWKKNRRVEFRVVETKTGPTGVELGCPNAKAHGVTP